MNNGRLIFLFLVLGSIVGALDASDGDADPLYRACIEICKETGPVGDKSIQHCQYSPDGVNKTTHMQEPLYLRWKHWNCRNECHYQCMMEREKERAALGMKPVKYHGKWPFTRVSVFQEPVSAALSALNLLVQIKGWRSFFLLLYFKFPQSRTYYRYTALWHIYGLLSTNAWFWSAIYHCRDFGFIEKLHYSSSAAVLGYSLILALLRTFNVKDNTTGIMVAAPILAFLATHILYLNFYELDYGLDMKVCVVMGIAQVLLWAIWAAITRHPSKLKLWTVVIGGELAMLLEAYDFPPYKGYVDARTLRHAVTIPLSYLWWSFVKDDAETCTSALVKKSR